MNINELCLELNKLLHESGWLAKATEFFQNHPELYSKAAVNGYIASLTTAVSFQPSSLSGVKDAKPVVIIESFKDLSNNYSLNEYTDSTLRGYFNMFTTDYEYCSGNPKPIERVTFYQQASLIGNLLIKRYTMGQLKINHVCTRTWSISDWDAVIDTQDIKDPVEYYQDERHVWCVIKGQFWENTKTGKIGQDSVIMEAWF